MTRRRWSNAIIVVVGTALVSSCSPTTIGVLNIDLLSFISPQNREVDVVIPEFQPIELFFFPGLQVDETGAGADENMRLGTLITFPAPPEQSGLVVELTGTFVVSNQHSSADSPAGTINVVIADRASGDIYGDGAIIGSATIVPIPAGNSDIIGLQTRVSSEDAEFDIIKSGAFRLGLRIQIDATMGQAVPLHVDINGVSCEVQVRLYSLFQLLHLSM